MAKKKNVRFPLIEMGITENDALQICYNAGFDFGGLYRHFKRVSCFCCPLQGIRNLRVLRKEFQDLWNKMLAWDAEIGEHNKGFRGYDKLSAIEKRLAFEEACMLPFMKEPTP